MVDEGGWTKPELCAILPTRIHDTKVVNARFKQCSLLLGRQLADATNQHRDLLILPPAISKCASTKSTTKYRTITTRKLQFYWLTFESNNGWFWYWLTAFCDKKLSAEALTSFWWRIPCHRLCPPLNSGSKALRWCRRADGTRPSI